MTPLNSGHFAAEFQCEDVAVGGGHRHVDAGREQHPTLPGVRRETHTVRRGESSDTPDFGQAAGAGDIRLGDIESTALEQILEVEPRDSRSPEAMRIVVERRTSA